jgi:hypothetical protein
MMESPSNFAILDIGDHEATANLLVLKFLGGNIGGRGQHKKIAANLQTLKPALTLGTQS